jgi:excisionase family DNA binding protein
MNKNKAIPQQDKPVRGILLSAEEAAKKIGMSREWINKHAHEGTLPFPYFSPGPRKRLFDSADIEYWQRITKIPAGKKPVGI